MGRRSRAEWLSSAAMTPVGPRSTIVARSAVGPVVGRASALVAICLGLTHSATAIGCRLLGEAGSEERAACGKLRVTAL